MKKIIILTLVANGGMAIGQSSLAADTDVATQSWNRHQGFYIEANAGPNLYFDGGYLHSIFLHDPDVNYSGILGGGWSAALGYALTPHFAAEAGFMQNFGSYTNTAGENLSFNTNIPYAALRLTVPLGTRAALFGKIGAMYASVTTENDTDPNSDDNDSSALALPYTGVGFSYALTQKLDISIQYQGALYGIINAGLFSGGLTYHFQS